MAHLARQLSWQRALASRHRSDASSSKAQLLRLPGPQRLVDLSKLRGLDVVALNAGFSACRGGLEAYVESWKVRLRPLASGDCLVPLAAFAAESSQTLRPDLRLSVSSERRVQLDVIASTALLKTLNAWRGALAMLGEVAGRQLRVDDMLLGTAMTACGSAWRAVLAMRRPSLHAWNACAAASAAGSAWRLALGAMTSLGHVAFKRDVVTCGSGLHACDVGRSWRMALAIFQEMWEHGPSPNVVACGSALSAASQAARGGYWALEALEDMRFRQLEVGVVCFNAALTACASSSLWVECLALLEEFRPNMVSYGAAMAAMQAVERWKDALGLYADAVTLGLQPSLVAASSALAAYKHEPSAWRLAMEHMAGCKAQHLYPPNLIMANTLSSLCPWRSCTSILQLFPSWRLQAEQQSYGNLATSLNSWRQGLDLLKVLEVADLHLDPVSLSSVLRLQVPRSFVQLMAMVERDALEAVEKGRAHSRSLPTYLLNIRASGALVDAAPGSSAPQKQIHRPVFNGPAVLGGGIAYVLFLAHGMLDRGWPHLLGCDGPSCCSRGRL